MTISEITKQDSKRISYLDLTLEGDTKKFVDPNLIALIAQREKGYIQKLARQAITQIDVFFKKIVDIHSSQLSYTEKRKRFYTLFSHFSEPQILHIGLSNEGNRGKGTTPEELVTIFMNPEIISLILNDDGLSVFQKSPLIPYFGDDKLSDLISNIIMNTIIDFNKYLLKNNKDWMNYLSNQTEDYYYFSENGNWEIYQTDTFLFCDKKVLLIPKAFTVNKQTSSLSVITKVYFREAMIFKGLDPNKTTIKEGKEKILGNEPTKNMRNLFHIFSKKAHKNYQKELNLKAYERKRDNDD